MNIDTVAIGLIFLITSVVLAISSAADCANFSQFALNERSEGKYGKWDWTVSQKIAFAYGRSGDLLGESTLISASRMLVRMRRHDRRWGQCTLEVC